MSALGTVENGDNASPVSVPSSEMRIIIIIIQLGLIWLTQTWLSLWQVQCQWVNVIYDWKTKKSEVWKDREKENNDTHIQLK